MRSAVALFAFNRPERTERVFATIRAARPPRLFLVCDGPRAGREGEPERCAQVRALIERVDWPCDVERDYADANLGCRRRLSSGIAWVFSRVEEAVFLEDDTLPDASFFPYCDELLDRYRHDERVLIVSGYNGLGRGPASGASYWFSAHPRVWGWAGWRRSWAGYDVEMREWPAMRGTPAWSARTRDERRAFGSFFDAVKAGLLDTWDAQLQLHAWRLGALSAIPSVNLVENIGFGLDATNTHAPEFPGPRVGSIPFPLRHPTGVVQETGNDADWVRLEYPPPTPLWRRAVRKFARLMRG